MHSHNLVYWMYLNGMSVPGDVPVHDSELKDNSNTQVVVIRNCEVPGMGAGLSLQGEVYSTAVWLILRKSMRDQNTGAFIPKDFPE